jgi:NAD(P)-dependent dehydrogenase (short-subunit alcohol dehydrogenase family)
VKLPLDVTESDSVEAAVARTLEQFGRIDVLVNNAGYAIRGALEEVPLPLVEQMFEVNVFGVLRMIQAVAPVMRKQREPGISSTSARLRGGYPPRPTGLTRGPSSPWKL